MFLLNIFTKYSFVILLLLLPIHNCFSQSKTPVEVNYHLKESPPALEQYLRTSSSPIKEIYHTFDALAKPKNPPSLTTDLSSTWMYAKGRSSEGLDVTLTDLPDSMERTKTRHRINEPNKSLWYKQKVSFGQPVTVKVNADDGAQVWYAGKRITSYRGPYFHLPASDKPAYLVVRVINNAMSGGLNSVQVYDQQSFVESEQYRHLYQRIEFLVRKILLLNDLPEKSASVIQKSIEYPTVENISAAEKELQEYPYFVTPPYLQQTDSNSVSILWETDIVTSHQLDWGTHPRKLSQTIKSDSALSLHEGMLTNIKPGETYYYQITQRKNQSRIFPFKVPEDTTHFQFAIWGDSQSGWDTFDQMVHAMQAHPVQFSIGVGDLVNQAWRPQQYSQLLQDLHPVSAHIPTFFLPGNHDYDGFYEKMIAEDYHRYVRNGQKSPQTYYSWTIGNAAFIALDPHITFPVGIPEDSAQYKWLLNELNKPSWIKATWHFILIHHPPYAQAWPGYHGELSIRETLEPLIEEYGIDFIVAGHNHAFERLTKTYGDQTTYYIITGGAGGSLEDEQTLSDYPQMDKIIFDHHYTHWQIKADTITFKVIDNNRQVLDQLIINK